ncbi:TlpA disulfide reductase family protein [Aquimarina sp. 2201CG5-10]|uniref:TlpA family protein disulfide reductase n=1 Tax=Aquimarina callyspongiae TaxID=3098150 RepID=UPI002AB57A94|nr:TlpA disulfide reductase family protein [Aquimarina sp. 2201CG5-10]MDY8137055.1 TlpA disulfide reductase family protein [Aquimarina sp. 2201CG5-10]
MNKKMFWLGFPSGIMMFLGLSAIIYFIAFKAPGLELSNMQLKDLEGNVISIENYTEKPMVVNYWATWCAPCIEEFPHFEEVKQELNDQIEFVMISDESQEKISSFASNKSYTFTFLRSKKNLSAYNIYSRPTTYFYNKEGKLVTSQIGGLTKKRLKELIKQIQ